MNDVVIPNEYLLVLDGATAGNHYPLSAETWIGRDPTSDVFLNTPRVSRRHAVLITNTDGSYTLADASSRNGTFINGKPIERQRIEVGDRFNIGNDVTLMVTRLSNLDQQLRREDRLGAVGRLAQTIAHDLRNTIGTVTAVAGYLETHPAAEEHLDIAQCAQELNAATEAGLKLLEQLATFADGRTARHTHVFVTALLAKLEQLVRRGLPPNIHFAIHEFKTNLELTGDENQLLQALLNLCRNSLDAMPGGGTLTINAYQLDPGSKLASSSSTLRSGQWVVFEVRDTGEGMSAQTMARIFEPFFTTKGDKGTGVGLASVHGTIRQHNGRVEVTSKVGKGTTFYVLLPAYTETTLLDPASDGWATQFDM